MPPDLRSRGALVTGAGRGIGRAIALALAAAGARVTAAARTAAELDAVVAEIDDAGGEARAFACDVADPHAVAPLIAAATPVDILVNSAGIAPSGPLLELDEEVWARTLQVNVTAPLRLMKAALPGMVARGWGRVINIASVASKTALPLTAAYTASKHALLGLTRVAAAEMARHGVTVNAICPGYANTPMTTANAALVAGRTGKRTEDVTASFARTSPQGRLVEPEEIAYLALLLCGDGARGVTGQGLNVDGGFLFS
jgi:NAD(P)-dependent dehydrogenase (short-subunit alcohol dehydrogenase family)